MDHSDLIFLCGVPGSKWSGVDTNLRKKFNADRTDETPERIFYHSEAEPGNPNNGHRGAYWGPGQGCGEDWDVLEHLGYINVLHDIYDIFSGEGPKVIKSHMFARHDNLSWIYKNFTGARIFLVYREPELCYNWWYHTMKLEDGYYPDYRPMYIDYNIMRKLIHEESANIRNFAYEKGMSWVNYSKHYETRHDDVFLAETTIGE